MSEIQALAVFCGSRSGSDTGYEAAARDLGRALVERGIRLVYGGGGIGLMGVVCRTVLDDGGLVTAVIPRFLQEMEGVGRPKVSELLIVDSMHDRKRTMFELADGFVILPGGLGTLDEMIEIITWKQLRLHSKPIVLVNIGGYWDAFLSLFARVVERDFAHPAIAELVTPVDSIDAVFPALAAAPEPKEEVLTSHL